MALKGTAIGDLFGPGHVLVIAKIPESVLYLENIFLGGWVQCVVIAP